MFFSVLIPAYNRSNILETSIKSLIDQIKACNFSGELVVIDDGSQDETLKLLEYFSFIYPNIFIYQTQINQGISKTRNNLVNLSRGEILIFIDSDVIPSEKLIENHLSLFKKKKNIISQGQLILTPSLKEVGKKKKSFLTDASTAFFDTANLAVSKENILNAGLFDESFQQYGWEDLDLGIRLKNMSIKVLFNKSAKAYHLEPTPDLTEISKYKDKEFSRSLGAIYFYDKHKTKEVKMMTQIGMLYFQFNYFLGFIISNKYYFKLLKIIKSKNLYNLYIAMLRVYFNYFYVSCLSQNYKKIKSDLTSS